MTMRIGSLFSGIGGLELGLEWAGLGPVVWQVERDPYCQRVLARHWPAATRYDDVCSVGAHNLAPVDLICGGFPCQDISFAGKGAGLSGERSGLWFEFARIVRELGPTVVVVENVRALLVRGMDAVLGTLADCGYDAEWSVLSAADVGAPHLRERVFIVAYAQHDRLPQRWGAALARSAMRDGRRVRRDVAQGGAQQAGALLAYPGGRRRGTPERDLHAGEPDALGCREDVPDANCRHAQGLVAWRDDAQDGRIARERPTRLRGGTGAHLGWATEPDVGRVAHGVPARVDRLRALGNAVVPQCAEVVGRRVIELLDELVERAS